MDYTRLYLTSARTQRGPWHTAHRGQLCLCVTGERQSEEGRSVEHPGLWLHNTRLCVSSQVPLVQLFRNAKYSILKGPKWGFPGRFQHIKGYLWEQATVRSEVWSRVPSTPSLHHLPLATQITQSTSSLLLSRGACWDLAQSRALNWIRHTRLFRHCAVAWECCSLFPW